MRPRGDLARVTAVLLEQTRMRPALAALAKVDPAEVERALANLEHTHVLYGRIGELYQRVKDARLAWAAEAWSADLRIYAVAKAAQSSDPTLRQAIDPIREMFLSSGKKDKDKEA